MAVVSISRIQVRRGKANSGTGFPQLASGEVGWAIDSQELYIGNGSVSEGAPAVGNTRILTQQDLDDFNTNANNENNILNTQQYVYRANDPSIVTGINPDVPVYRTLRAKLDDYVTAFDFGAINDGITDTSFQIQHAINQLFLNETAIAAVDSSRRKILEIPAGTYLITTTIFIPSYTNILGAGSEKTIFKFTGPGAAFRFVNDTSIGDRPSTIDSTLGVNQPRNISIAGLTISTVSTGVDTGFWGGGVTYIIGDLVTYNDERYIAIQSGTNHIPTTASTFWTLFTQIGLQLDAVSDSNFEDIIINGNYDYIDNTNHNGIKLSAVSNIVTCQHNHFNQVSIIGFHYAVVSNQDIVHNTFSNCYIEDAIKGVVLGVGTSGTTVGQMYGPRSTIISNCNFKDIKQHAVYIKYGAGNTIDHCSLLNVGNNGGGITSITYPQIFIDVPGNDIRNVSSDRSLPLSSSSYSVSSRELTLSTAVTAPQDAIVEQPATGANGFLLSAVAGSVVITLVNLNGIDFNNVSDIYINGVTNPSVSNTPVHPTVIGSLNVVGYIPYIAETAGMGLYTSFGSREITLAMHTSDVTAFRLPVACTEFGVPTAAIFYTVNYLYRSTAFAFSRRGTLHVVADVANKLTELTDEYDFTGPLYEGEDAIRLRFKSHFVDQDGFIFTDQINQTISAIVIQYQNSFTNDDDGVFTYSYTATY